MGLADIVNYLLYGWLILVLVGTIIAIIIAHRKINRKKSSGVHER